MLARDAKAALREANLRDAKAWAAVKTRADWEARPLTPEMITYAAGDVAGRFLFTHSAGYEAARAIRNMFLPGSSGGDYLVPWCTFTDPELAHAGLTEAQARERLRGIALDEHANAVFRGKTFGQLVLQIERGLEMLEAVLRDVEHVRGRDPAEERNPVEHRHDPLPAGLGAGRPDTMLARDRV